MRRSTMVISVLVVAQLVTAWWVDSKEEAHQVQVQQQEERIQKLKGEVAGLQSELTQVKYDKHNTITKYNKSQEDKNDLAKELQATKTALSAERKKSRNSKDIVKATASPSVTNATVRRVITAKATAYGTSVTDGGAGSGITATGIRPIEGTTIAADPRVIPLGTKVRIVCEAYPEVNGVYTVQDTGGAIKGNKIDIFMSKRSKMLDFGRREVKIYVLS